MEQRDLLKDQIEQLGRALGRILAEFLGTKTEGDIAQSIEISNERFKSELDIDIEQLRTLDKEELAAYLCQRQLAAAHLETLSKYMAIIGTEISDEKMDEAKQYLKRAIDLLDMADEFSNTVCFERMKEKGEIENTLNNYK